MWQKYSRLVILPKSFYNFIATGKKPNPSWTYPSWSDIESELNSRILVGWFVGVWWLMLLFLSNVERESLLFLVIYLKKERNAYKISTSFLNNHKFSWHFQQWIKLFWECEFVNDCRTLATAGILCTYRNYLSRSGEYAFTLIVWYIMWRMCCNADGKL